VQATQRPQARHHVGGDRTLVEGLRPARRDGAQRPAQFRLDEAVAARIRRLTELTDFIWIVGNHDPSPPCHLGGRGAAELAIGPLIFRHDAILADDSAGGEVIGHYHPVATIATRGRSFRRRCFVIGGRRLLLPAFGAYAGGLNVREAAIRDLMEPGARLALLGRDRLHLFPFSAALPDASLPIG